MKGRSYVRSAVLLALILGMSSVAQAAPITYVISGIGSGAIGGTDFTDATVSFTVVGDTTDVVSLFGGLAFANPSNGTTVSIEGIGTATVTDPTAIYGIPNPIVDPDLPFLPLIIIGTLDDPPSLDSFTGLAATGSNDLLGYDLQTSIGPITGFGGVGGRASFVNSTLGNLSFISDIDENTQATFTATVSTVPEPASVLLLGTGGAALLASRRRKSSRLRS